MEGVPSPRVCQVLEEERYVRRLKEHMPDKFREMCYMHLSFILNLSGDKLERILEDEAKSCTRRRLALVNPIFKKKEKASGSLFGATITYDSVGLMAPLINVLSSKDNASKEGLFRKPGNRQRMRNLREALIETGPGLNIDTSVYNAHDVCGVLKEFLRELPEPLLTERHMEAHMQIAVLGSHAQTHEELSRYAHKKISALQLLMQLLPSATGRMIMEVLTLLHDISAVPETRMTPSTLATIFAPIFFFNKKVSPLDMCDVIKVVEPALAFMIENAQKMFKVPRELAVDIKTYCKSIGFNDDGNVQDATKVSQAYKIRKSISGRTLNTAVCYIDREQAKSQDSASTTQSELESLFAHIHALPDTPSNRRYKDLVARNSGTPVGSGKRHSRSKSIGASIKKHLPSISKGKTKNFDTATPDCANTPYRDILRNGVERHRVNCDSKVMVVNCTAARQRERNLKKSSPGEAAMMELLQSSGLRLSETSKAIAESMLMFSSPVMSPAHRPSPLQRRKRHSSEHGPSHYECTPPKQECSEPNQSVNKRSSLTTPVLHDRKMAKGTRLPLSPVQKNSPMDHSAAATPPASCESTDCLRVETPREIKEKLSSPLIAPVTGSENEISYLPSQLSSRNPVLPSKDVKSPMEMVTSRRPLRPCNTPGTPIVPRAALHLGHTISLETSI